MYMITEDKKGAMIIIKLALVIFFVLFLINLVKVDDAYAKWAILWLFVLGVFAKLKHKLMMQSLVKSTGKKEAVKPVLKAKKK